MYLWQDHKMFAIYNKIGYTKQNKPALNVKKDIGQI